MIGIGSESAVSSSDAARARRGARTRASVCGLVLAPFVKRVLATPGGDDAMANDEHPSFGDELGEATGGITGMLIGGIAGAIGGWWAGRAVAEAAGSLSHEDEEYYRAHYDSVPDRPADRD